MRRIVWAIADFRPARSEAAVTAIEYGLIGALIAVVIVAGVILVGGKLRTVFTSVSTPLAHSSSGSGQVSDR